MKKSPSNESSLPGSHVSTPSEADSSFKKPEASAVPPVFGFPAGPGPAGTLIAEEEPVCWQAPKTPQELVAEEQAEPSAPARPQEVTQVKEELKKED